MKETISLIFPQKFVYVLGQQHRFLVPFSSKFCSLLRDTDSEPGWPVTYQDYSDDSAGKLGIVSPWTTNMAAVAQKFLVRSIWSSFLKMSNRRATLHTGITLASTLEDPLVGIMSAVMHWFYPLSGVQNWRAARKQQEKNRWEGWSRVLRESEG